MGHVGGVYFQKMTETRIRHMPYRGSAPAMQDLVCRPDRHDDRCPGGDPATAARRHNQGLGGACKERLAQAPDIPTADEAGLPGLDVSNWFGFWAPKARRRKSSASSSGGGEQLSRSGREKILSTLATTFLHATSRPPRRSAHFKGRNREVVADHQGGADQGD